MINKELKAFREGMKLGMALFCHSLPNGKIGLTLHGSKKDLLQEDFARYVDEGRHDSAVYNVTNFPNE